MLNTHFGLSTSVNFNAVRPAINNLQAGQMVAVYRKTDSDYSYSLFNGDEANTMNKIIDAIDEYRKIPVDHW